MKKNEIILDGKKSIYLVGDTHYPRGIRQKFQHVVETIKNDRNSYMIGLGDWTEGISHLDPRYNPEEAHSISQRGQENLNMINNQWDDFEEDIKPITSQILGLHSGNHGSNVTRRYNSNYLESLCKRNSLRYLGDEVAIWKFVSGEHSAVFQTEHGCGGGVTPGFAVNKADAISRIFAGIDVVAMGHTHKLSVDIGMQPMDVSGDDIKQVYQYRCNCGSFLPNYLVDSPSYGERKLYHPLPMGYVRVDMDDCVINNVAIVPL